MLRQTSIILSIRAVRPGLHEFTKDAADFVIESGISYWLYLIAE